MSLEEFKRNSGFKVLAMAQLNSCEYSLILYLLNCSVSGLNNLITTESELESLIGYDSVTLHDALENLSSKGMIRLKYSDTQTGARPSLSISMQFDTHRWTLSVDDESTTHDAIVFPFRRLGQRSLTVVKDRDETEAEKNQKPKKTATWRRVFESYLQGRSLSDSELEEAEKDAHVLVETHPVDQILIMIRHFGARIPTLSLLASSWQHFAEMYENENHRVDLLEARHKHKELDDQLRKAAKESLSDSELSEEERTVLNIILKHRHPRRQLFWAYQTKGRYPGLAKFFHENASLMLPVTTSGSIVKRPPTTDSNDSDH